MQRQLELRAKDVRKKPMTLQPEKTLYDVRNTMLRYNISRVILSKDNKAVGIITEKDIARFLYRSVAGRRLTEIRAEEVMSTNLITVSEDTNLSACAKLMLDKEISSLIVIDEKGSLKGIVTKSDLIDAYSKYYVGRNVVENFMTKRVFTVAPDESIHSVLSIMTNSKVSRVVVVRNKKPIGIVTGRDLLPMSALCGPDVYETIREVFSTHKQAQVILPSGISAVFAVRDIMKHDPITVTGNSDMADAAHIMTRNRISGLPTVDSDNNLIGIVTKTDIVKALASEAM